MVNSFFLFFPLYPPSSSVSSLSLSKLTESSPENSSKSLRRLRESKHNLPHDRQKAHREFLVGWWEHLCCSWISFRCLSISRIILKSQREREAHPALFFFWTSAISGKVSDPVCRCVYVIQYWQCSRVGVLPEKRCTWGGLSSELTRHGASHHPLTKVKSPATHTRRWQIISTPAGSAPVFQANTFSLHYSPYSYLSYSQHNNLIRIWIKS